MSLRESFVARFGEDDAAAIESAASGHRAELLDGHKEGDDPFADALAVAIGFECVSRYRQYHTIEASESDMQAWAIEVGAFDRHVGPVDHLALMVGAYEPWIGKDTRS